VHVEQDREAVGVGPVEEPVDVLERAVGAADVGPVGLVHEVADGKPEGVDGLGLCPEQRFEIEGTSEGL